MLVSRFKSRGLYCLLWFHTAATSIKTACKAMFSKPDRAWFDKTIHAWCDKLLDGVKVDYRVVNPHNIELQENTPYILMCNHTSAYDIPLGFKAFPNASVRMLAKKELAKIPVFGKAMAAAEFPFVDRKNRTQAIKDLAHAKELMNSGIVLWMAPEGTRSRDGKLQAFKKGGFITAIQAQAKIIPIAIVGAYDIVKPKSKEFNLNQKVELRIGQEFDASKYTIEDKETLLNEVHQAMQALINA